jgi:hypothetical protein
MHSGAHSRSPSVVRTVSHPPARARPLFLNQPALFERLKDWELQGVQLSANPLSAANGCPAAAAKNRDPRGAQLSASRCG